MSNWQQSNAAAPLYLGSELNYKVMTYLHTVREIGYVMNRNIAMACALGIVKEYRPGLLKGHGGSLDLVSKDGNGRSWSNSLLERAGMVKRKAAKKLPSDFN